MKGNSSRTAEPINTTSTDINEDRLVQLRALFPEAFTEGKVDFGKLRATLGDLVDDRPERYSFTWAGKQDAIRILQTPTNATLRPVPNGSVNFNETRNVFIEGDNLEVLKLLYKPYFGRVKMIYIDPPYNTGNDFVYPDNYTDPLTSYLQLTGQIDAKGNMLTTNSDVSGRYHSAWLNMMYPRLFIARQLLRNDGIIFITIDDSEFHNLRNIMNELFGEENFLAAVAWEKRYTRSNNARMFYSLKDYVLIYRKSDEVSFLREKRTEKANSIYSNPDQDPRGPWTSSSYVNPATKVQRPNLVYTIKNPYSGERIDHPTHAWKYSKEEHDRHVHENNLWWGQNKDAKFPRLKIYQSETEGGMVPIDIWDHEQTGTTDEGGGQVKGLFGEAVFDNPKPTKLIKRMMHLATSPEEESLVMDFFSGSATTAHAVLELNLEDGGNRRFILIQLPEKTPEKSTARKFNFDNIAEIGKERLRRVIAKAKTETEGQLSIGTIDRADLGFKVFKLTPSNFHSWRGTNESTPQEFANQMALFDDPLIENWTPTNVIFEIALKEGYSLNCYIQHTAVAGHVVYLVSDQEKDQQFYICLDDKITQNLAAELELTPEDLFICRDIALDDTMAANLALQCRLKSI